MKNKKTVKYNKCLGQMYSVYRQAEGKSLREKIHNVIDILEKGMYGIDRNSSAVSDNATMINAAVHDAAACLYADITNKAVHIFIDSEALVEFLEETEVKDVDGMKKYVLQNGFYRFFFDIGEMRVEMYEAPERLEGIVFDDFETARKRIKDDFSSYTESLQEQEKKEQEDVAEKLKSGLRLEKHIVLCLHLPGRTGDSTYYVGLNDIDDFHIMSMTARGFSYDSINGSEDLARTNEAKFQRAVFNVIAYINAFPECVRDGLPKGFSFENPSGSKKVRLRENEFVKKHAEYKTAGYTVSPHFRSGHFRFLESERFVNKRGQFVYVKPTVVNQKNVKTVTSEEE